MIGSRAIYIWATMQALKAPLKSWIGMAVLLVVMLSGCGKDEVVAPATAPGVTKSIGSPTVTDDPANSGGQPNFRGGSGNESISDDGDDVGDGERNKKKKPN